MFADFQRHRAEVFAIYAQRADKVYTVMVGKKILI